MPFDFGSLEVLVVGDLILDRYVDGSSTRSCPEADDVPVIDQSGDTCCLGGSGNVAANASSLGAHAVTLIGVAGDDWQGHQVTDLLGSSLVRDRLTIEQGRKTLAKTRIGMDEKLVARVDRGDISLPDPLTIESVIADLDECWKSADVVMVADLGKGTLTDQVIDKIMALQSADPKVLVIDAKQAIKYRGCEPTVVKMNWAELQHLLGAKQLAGNDRPQAIAEMRSVIGSRCVADIVAVTLDVEGSLVFNRGGDVVRTKAAQVEPAYPSGAGDTFAACFGLGIASVMNLQESADLAQRAAEIAVADPHTHATTMAELIGKVERPRIVLATGVYDVLHSGHASLLQYARSLGDKLIVGINSDESVRRLKGASRPINREVDRANLLRELRSVDQVVVFDDAHPGPLIRTLRPDILVKGSDYSSASLPEQPALDDVGCQVRFFPLLSGHSTTATLHRLNGLMPVEA